MHTANVAHHAHAAQRAPEAKVAPKPAHEADKTPPAKSAPAKDVGKRVDVSA